MASGSVYALMISASYELYAAILSTIHFRTLTFEVAHKIDARRSILARSVPLTFVDFHVAIHAFESFGAVTAVLVDPVDARAVNAQAVNAIINVVITIRAVKSEQAFANVSSA